MRSLLPWVAFATLACQNKSPDVTIDPRLIAEAEALVKPNDYYRVSDGTLDPGIYFIVHNGYGYPRADPQADERPIHELSAPYGIIFVDPSPIVTLGNFTNIRTDDAMNGGREVRVDLDEVGSARFLVATRGAIGYMLAFVVGDSVVCTPTVTAEVSNGRLSIDLGTYMSAPEVEAFAQRMLAEKPGVAPAR